ncbi:uncharacterized protein LOC130898862 isoform X1 [Diorhabda carinulata]|uniref:uncharacterized protein LOC130898862 isoform X1 n=1 Tax=Diorhabda carinulata TaxID=1163345 RepID=UPI0025A12331|nr:uncharacterized protein LOC130898862 isoform X1 [Diorhabda carinulata]XP_057664409.1 uncharacterized protein LOC130898862 isoform X1 [Diorhabda carinulata]XP_057664410.1 uncharacterized protein LOC130898862 isoform X1 [Diorhabda carinulata]
MAAGSAVAMIGANLRFGSSAANSSLNATKVFQCHPGGTAEAALIFALGTLGMAANFALMGVILANRQLRRWSQGLLFHQGAVDCARAALLLPLGVSILHCQPVQKCSLVETAFLLLVTVATVNMLTTVLNDSPIFPDDDEAAGDVATAAISDAPLLMDSPQCVLFGTFMIWFASITINLGPTFLSGALAAQGESGHKAPSCPLIHGPLRHYILNALWIAVNLVCVFLTLFHLKKLHRDLTKANVEAVRVAGLVTTLVNVTGGPPNCHMNTTEDGSVVDGIGSGNGIGIGVMGGGGCGALEEHRRMRDYLRRMEREGVQRVKMFLVITAAYVLFWGPLFFVTLVNHPVVGNPLGHEITLHISYVHAIVNPTLFLVLHRGLRRATLDICCGWIPVWLVSGPSVPPPPDPPRAADISLLKPPLLPAPAHPDSSMGNPDLSPWTPVQQFESESLNNGILPVALPPHYTNMDDLPSPQESD